MRRRKGRRCLRVQGNVSGKKRGFELAADGWTTMMTLSSVCYGYDA